MEKAHIIYNAKHTPAEDVAKTFVPGADFTQLQRPSHSVLLGARGCGKTTLMKMLTTQALYNWDHEEAASLREKLEFISIYIPTDIYWNTNKEAYYEQIETRLPRFAQAVSKAAVNVRVFTSLLDALEGHMSFVLGTTDARLEEQVAMSIIREWRLPAMVPEMGVIRVALSSLSSEIAYEINRVTHNCFSDADVSFDAPIYNLDFEAAVFAVIEAYCLICNVSRKTRWALCFDELELAPRWLHNRLFESLRSRSEQRLIYKLSASPITTIPKDILARPIDDVDLIKMWPHKRRGQDQTFSKKIVRDMVQREFGANVTPRDIFGVNNIYRKSSRGDYDKEGDTWVEIRELAIVDSSFRAHLIKYGIDPLDPSVCPENKRKKDTELRKIKPLAYFRNYYINYKETVTGRKVRPRKQPTLFHGEEVAYVACDGNPRWIHGVMDLMLSESRTSENRRIPDNIQGATYSTIAERFLDSLRGIPKANYCNTEGKVFTLADIVGAIGAYFQSKILDEKFDRDPVGSFTVDARIPPDLLPVISEAIYQGAFVILDTVPQGFDTEIVGKRYRISYLFYPHFHLPLRKYKTVALSTILNNIIDRKAVGSAGRKDTGDGSQVQMKLH